MKTSELKRRWNQAVRNQTPDVLEEVLARCGQITQDRPATSQTAMPVKHKKLPVFRIAAAAAAFCVVVCCAAIGFRNYNFYRITSIVDLDVNPGIELRVNSGGRVLSAAATDADGAAILDDMDLSSVDMDVAVNALIGSMLKNGYLSDLQNSVLISVYGDDQDANEALRISLEEEISQLLSASSIDGAILNQSLTVDDDLQSLADTYGISLGKASLIQLILQSDTNRIFAELAGLTINDLNLIATTKSVASETISSSGAASEKSYIGGAAALKIALEHAGLAEDDVAQTDIEFDCEDGQMIYEVEFDSGNQEYEYEINATTGEILSAELPRANSAQAETEGTADAASGGDASAGTISLEQAKSIALNHAGLTASQVRFKKAELEREDGAQLYEIEFMTGDLEYEYEIRASDGTILDWDRDDND